MFVKVNVIDYVILILYLKKGRDYILIHFLQDVVTEAQGGPYPHISPIGAYDEASKRVLVMDVDREWYEPYWVSDERLLLSMSKKTERYGLGGYLWIRPKSYDIGLLDNLAETINRYSRGRFDAPTGERCP